MCFVVVLILYQLLAGTAVTSWQTTKITEYEANCCCGVLTYYRSAKLFQWPRIMMAGFSILWQQPEAVKVVVNRLTTKFISGRAHP